MEHGNNPSAGLTVAMKGVAPTHESPPKYFFVLFESVHSSGCGFFTDSWPIVSFHKQFLEQY
jgi:hypothetical protein